MLYGSLAVLIDGEGLLPAAGVIPKCHTTNWQSDGRGVGIGWHRRVSIGCPKCLSRTSIVEKIVRVVERS